MMPDALTTVTALDGSLTSDLQQAICPLDRKDQNGLRMLMAMRAMRSVAADPSRPKVDLLVIENLLSNWWRDWSDPDANPLHPFAVEMPKGTLGEVTNLCEADLAASLASLQAQGLVVVRPAEEQAGPRCGELYDLRGTFDLAGPELSSTLHRTLIERHRSEVVWAAEQTLQIVSEDFEQLRLWAGSPGALSFGRRWRAFLNDYANHGPKTMWEEDPASVYTWLSTLADFQDEMGVLQGHPCECSMRTDLAKWTGIKIAVLSRRYRAHSPEPSV